jgi:hypothetical protein
MQSVVVSPTRRLAGGKFDDFRRDLILPYLPLHRLQGGNLALDLVARRGHRFHARFVLSREGVEQQGPLTAPYRSRHFSYKRPIFR